VAVVLTVRAAAATVRAAAVTAEREV